MVIGLQALADAAALWLRPLGAIAPTSKRSSLLEDPICALPAWGRVHSAARADGTGSMPGPPPPRPDVGRLPPPLLIATNGFLVLVSRNSGLESMVEEHTHSRTQQVLRPEEIAMKTILSVLIALLLIAGVAGSAGALDAKTFYERIDRDHY